MKIKLLSKKIREGTEIALLPSEARVNWRPSINNAIRSVASLGILPYALQLTVSASVH